ncbi:MAG: cupin domain-containing protein [Proteobacteria bacterium]|nr:cupin domain-containing protein [Pseudomonadota bacterium]
MLVRQAALKALDFAGLRIFDYTAGTDLESSLALIEVPPKAAHGEAWSRRSDKYYLVVSGEIRFSLEGDEFALRTGDFCLVERGKRFDYRNDGPAAATLVLVHTPSFDLNSEVFVT